MKQKCEAGCLNPGDHTAFGKVVELVHEEDEEKVIIAFDNGSIIRFGEYREIIFWEDN